MSNDRRDEPFLSRWSRQKRTAAHPETDPVAAGRADSEAPEIEPEVDLSTLPSIDDLTADSDITGFLRKGVPEALQRLALRKMWSLDPAIRDFIEVAENQWDFNAPGGVPGLFEELAPGSGLGVWLAQATPSTLPPVASTAPYSQNALAVASQQRTPAEGSELAIAKNDVHLQSGSASQEIETQPQPAEIVDELAGQADLQEKEAPAERRRHGGALPR